ncbi:MAG: hypothetical protein JNL83_00360 [Myxococcales bacterium]|nr:hypothetical protein [Myxococcales bacterium]
MWTCRLGGWLAILTAACVPAPVGAQYQGTGAPAPGYRAPYGQPAPAALPAGLEGTFYAINGSLTFRPDGAYVRGEFIGPDFRIDLSGEVRGEVVSGQYVTSSSGRRGNFTARRDGELLRLNLDGDEYPLETSPVIVDAGGSTPPAAQPARPADPAGPPPAPLATDAATGAIHTDKIGGWQIRAPARWSREYPTVYASPSKRTRILLKFLRATSLAAAIRQELDSLSNATTRSRPRDETIGGLRAVVMDLSGHRTDGDDPLQWRAIWIAGTEGVFEIISVGSPDEAEQARVQVDGIARTLRFVPADRGPVARAVGCFSFFNASSGVTVSRTVQLDGKGNASASGDVASVTEVKEYGSGRHAGYSEGYVSTDPEKGVYGIDGDTLTVQWNDATATTYRIHWNGGRIGYLQRGSDAYVACI